MSPSVLLYRVKENLLAGDKEKISDFVSQGLAPDSVRGVAGVISGTVTLFISQTFEGGIAKRVGSLVAGLLARLFFPAEGSEN